MIINAENYQNHHQFLWAPTTLEFHSFLLFHSLCLQPSIYAESYSGWQSLGCVLESLEKFTKYQCLELASEILVLGIPWRSTAGGMGLLPGQETKVLNAVQRGQKKKKKEKPLSIFRSKSFRGVICRNYYRKITKNDLGILQWLRDVQSGKWTCPFHSSPTFSPRLFIFKLISAFQKVL